MKDGDIIEQEIMKSSLARKGFYADLYNSQFEKKRLRRETEIDRYLRCEADFECPLRFLLYICSAFGIIL